jgi:serine/threonine protein kinase
MELVEGEELGDLVERLGALPVRGALLVATALAEVLAHLHARAIYHRDVKPANVIVLPDHGVKLVDFGIAREEGKQRLTMSDHRIGTAAYSPPEWVKPEGVKPHLWDLYALGVMLDEMLTGRERFPAHADMPAMAHAVKVMAEKATIEHLDPGPEIPKALRGLVCELTSRDPARRPATAREVHHRLKELLRQPHVASSPGLSERSLPGDFEDPDDTWLASQEGLRPTTAAPARSRIGTRGLLAFSVTVLLASLAAFALAAVLAAAVAAWTVAG